MMTRSTLVFVGALLAVVSGCDSEVNGGGGGSGGGSGGGANVAQGTGNTSTAAVVSTGSDTTSTSSSDGGSTAEGTSVTVGPGGGGGGNVLGECEQDSGTSGSSDGGTTECVSDFICDGGNPSVACSDDGTTETCECSLNGAFVGSCVDEDRSGCGFPQNCCFALLGGHAEPNPGPYGSCDNTSGSATSSGSAGSTEECGSYYDCAGGEMQIECTQPSDGGDATCECIDGNYFLIGSCSQPTLDCDYESNCCHAIFN